MKNFIDWLKSKEWGLYLTDINDLAVEHDGDCTNISCPCILCNLEYALAKYRYKTFGVKNKERAVADYRCFQKEDDEEDGE